MIAPMFPSNLSYALNNNLSFLLLLGVVLLFNLIPSSDAQGFRARGRDRNRPRLAPGTSVFDNLNDTIRCNNRFRTFDGTCTNKRFKLAGAAGTAAFAYDPFLSSDNPTGDILSSPRFISNVLCTQTGDIPSQRRLNELVTYFGQFLDHTFVASTSDGTAFNIPIDSTDPASQTSLLVSSRSHVINVLNPCHREWGDVVLWGLNDQSISSRQESIWRLFTGQTMNEFRSYAKARMACC